MRSLNPDGGKGTGDRRIDINNPLKIDTQTSFLSEAIQIFVEAEKNAPFFLALGRLAERASLGCLS